MGARGFYYDDCRSTDRLSRDWTPVGADVWSVGYDSAIGKSFYRITSAVGGWDQLINKSLRVGMPLEVHFLVRSSLAANGPKCGVQIKGRNDSRGDMDIGFHLHTSIIWAEATYNTIGTWAGSGMVAVYAPNTWFNVKARFDRDLKCKVWKLGDAELDWGLTAYYKGALPNGVQWTGPPVKSGYFSLISEAVAGNTYDYADIRVAPVRRAGWP